MFSALRILFGGSANRQRTSSSRFQRERFHWHVWPLESRCMLATDLVTTGQFNDDTGDGVINDLDFLDLAIANAESGVSVRLGLGDGMFKEAGPFTVGGSPVAVTTGQFNDDTGDGVINDLDFLDLATANASDGSVSVLRGFGDGMFKKVGGPFPVDGNPVSVTTGQFNDDTGDGVINDLDFLDLATANASDGSVSVLRGFGDGMFEEVERSPFNVGGRPVSVTTGQFYDDNDDGVIDDLDFLHLATANESDNSVSVLRNFGDFDFEEVDGPFDVGGSPVSVTTGQFNDDTGPNGTPDGVIDDLDFLDLVTANESDNDVSVLLGSGDGDFQEEPRVGVGFGPRSVTTGQFNDDTGDGMINDLDFLDLATANKDSNDVSVLLGRGNGKFSLENINSLFQDIDIDPGGPVSVTTGDFNSDRVLDLAAVNEDGKITPLFGSGEGFFSLAAVSPPSTFSPPDITGSVVFVREVSSIFLPAPVFLGAVAATSISGGGGTAGGAAEGANTEDESLPTVEFPSLKLPAVQVASVTLDVQAVDRPEVIELEKPPSDDLAKALLMDDPEPKGQKSDAEAPSRENLDADAVESSREKIGPDGSGPSKFPWAATALGGPVTVPAFSWWMRRRKKKRPSRRE